MPINLLREQLPNLFVYLLLRQEAAFGIEAVHLTEIVALAEQLYILLVDILLQGNGLLVDILLAVQVVAVVARTCLGEVLLDELQRHAEEQRLVGHRKRIAAELEVENPTAQTLLLPFVGQLGALICNV